VSNERAKPASHGHSFCSFVCYLCKLYCACTASGYWQPLFQACHVLRNPVKLLRSYDHRYPPPSHNLARRVLAPPKAHHAEASQRR
jgi:hypothetical protein